MKILPFIEDIYDLDTEQLNDLSQQIRHDLTLGPKLVELPTGVDSFDKFKRKCAKIIKAIDQEV